MTRFRHCHRVGRPAPAELPKQMDVGGDGYGVGPAHSPLYECLRAYKTAGDVAGPSLPEHFSAGEKRYVCNRAIIGGRGATDGARARRQLSKRIVGAIAISFGSARNKP
jgi:hypothetical protein